MIARKRYDDLIKRIATAWGDDLTPSMRDEMEKCSLSLKHSMVLSLWALLSPPVVIKLIDDGRVSELRARAERCKALMELLFEFERLVGEHLEGNRPQRASAG